MNSVLIFIIVILVFCLDAVSMISSSGNKMYTYAPIVEPYPRGYYIGRRNTSSDDYVLLPAASSPHAKDPIVYKYWQTKEAATNSTTEANIVLVENPRTHFYVQTPTTGCGTRQKTTTNAIKRGCTVAYNAGFFNVTNGDCLGNVIANRVVVQQTCTQNANFGLTTDGNFIMGYLSCHTVKYLQFESLVQGVGWLVRDGRSYVTRAAVLEQISDHFVYLKAPRVALGVDKRGRLLMVQVNGYFPDKPGFDLYEMANLMIKLGAIQAVNLDGGGSSTVFVDKTIKSLCSDKCSQFQDNLCPNKASGCCERTVTTIICIA